MKEVASWDINEVSIWLHCIGLSVKVEIFRKNSIDGETLLTLTEEDFISDLGLNGFDAKAIKNCLANTHQVLATGTKNSKSRTRLKIEELEKHISYYKCKEVSKQTKLDELEFELAQQSSSSQNKFNVKVNSTPEELSKTDHSLESTSVSENSDVTSAESSPEQHPENYLLVSKLTHKFDEPRLKTKAVDKSSFVSPVEDTSKDNVHIESTIVNKSTLALDNAALESKPTNKTNVESSVVETPKYEYPLKSASVNKPNREVESISVEKSALESTATDESNEKVALESKPVNENNVGSSVADSTGYEDRLESTHVNKTNVEEQSISVKEDALESIAIDEFYVESSAVETHNELPLKLTSINEATCEIEETLEFIRDNDSIVVSSREEPSETGLVKTSTIPVISTFTEKGTLEHTPTYESNTESSVSNYSKNNIPAECKGENDPIIKIDEIIKDLEGTLEQNISV